MQEKVLSQLHFQEGMKYFQKVEEDPSVMSKLIAIYMADAETLWMSKSNPELFEALEKKASLMDGEETAEVLGFFMVALSRYVTKLFNKAPKDLLKMVKQGKA